MENTANGGEVKAAPHTWHFFRSGGFDQVRLQSGADLQHLAQLDQKLWTALSCPVQGLEFNEKTLALIDTDNDGRIRAPEILAAVQWVCAQLKNPDDLFKRAATLPLAAINDATEEGKRLLASARHILANLGKPDEAVITVEDTSDTARIFAKTKFNGDGVITADSAENDVLKKIIEDIIACLGAETDLSGVPGVNAGKVEEFYKQARAYSEWRAQAEGNAATVLLLGDATADAAAAFEAVRAKVDDYFTRCRLAAYDARAALPLNPALTQYEAMANKDVSSASAGIISLPLSAIEAGRALPLREGVNPAWGGSLDALRAQCIAPLFGEKKNSLTEDEWAELSAKFAAFKAWQGAKQGAAMEKLGLARVRELLAGDGEAQLVALIARDKVLEAEAQSIAQVDRLTRYHRDLCMLLDNFVSFRDFYSGGEKAIFQAGTLYLDGRSCELCVRVEDMGKHGALASLSRFYLAYCDCTRRGSTEKMTIAAAVTGGDSDNLLVGRNGVFYDREGRDWDATIVKIVDHPISVRQAFWAPYKRVARMIGEQIEKFASSRDKAVNEKAAAGIAETGAQAEAGKPAAPAQPFDVAKFAGIFAAIGLAIGAIGTAIAAVVTGFLGLVWWQMPLAVGGLMLLISGPAMLIAYLKLRQRNLGPLLDANGWAINTRAKVNIPFGASLTGTAELSPGAERSVQDAFAEKRRPWGLYIFIAALLIGGCFAWFWMR